MSQCGKGVSIAVLFIPSINVRSGCFHVPLIFFFFGGGGGGGGAHISLFEFDTFCDAAPLYFTSV